MFIDYLNNLGIWSSSCHWQSVFCVLATVDVTDDFGQMKTFQSLPWYCELLFAVGRLPLIKMVLQKTRGPLHLKHLQLVLLVPRLQIFGCQSYWKKLWSRSTCLRVMMECRPGSSYSFDTSYLFCCDKLHAWQYTQCYTVVFLLLQ